MKNIFFLHLMLSCLAAAPASARADTLPWIAAFSAAPVTPIPENEPYQRDYANQFVRHKLRVAAAGSRMRVVLTNALGATPLRVDRMSLTSCAGTGDGASAPIRFDGRDDITLPAGAVATSDPIDLSVARLSEVAVSVHYPLKVAPAGHLSRVYVSDAPSSGAACGLPKAQRTIGASIVARIDVISPQTRGVIVALGDSITEGSGSTREAYQAWPDQFADRLAGHGELASWSIVNAGIGGNRLLHDDALGGPGALVRFDRDVLDVPGVKAIVLLEGINDIGFGAEPGHARESVSAADIIASYRRLIARTHDRGLTIIGATLAPFEGANYHDAAGEAKRQTVNAFIRSGVFDDFADIDRAVRDPAHPTRIRPDFDYGDHLHYNDAGYAAIAQAIPMAFLAR